MSSKLKTMEETHDSKLSNVALLLCAVEVGIFLGAILLELVFGRRLMLVNRISAISWLLFGGGSIVVSIVGFMKGQKRSFSISVAAACIAIFILCAFRFALV